MPDMCSCRLDIEADDAQQITDMLALIVRRLGADRWPETISFNSLVPVPDGVDATPHWGTKWEPTYAIIDHTVDQAQIEFEVPNGPPHPICREMARRFDLTVHVAWMNANAWSGGEATFEPDGSEEIHHATSKGELDELYRQLWTNA